MPSLLSSLAQRFRNRFSPEPAPDSSARKRRANAWLGNEDEEQRGAASGTGHAGTAGTSSIGVERPAATTTATTLSAASRTRPRPAVNGANGRPSKVARQAAGDMSLSLSLGRSAGGVRFGEVRSWDRQATRPRQSSTAPAPTTAPFTPAAAVAAAAVASQAARLGISAPSPSSSLRSIPTSAPPGSSLRSPSALHPATLLRPWQDAGASGGGGRSGSAASGLRAVAGGLSATSATTPRTPVHRWSGGGGTAARASSGVETRRDVLGAGASGVGGIGGVGGGLGVGGPPGYAYGMPVLPQSTPRRLIMATARSARVRSTGVGGEGVSGTRPGNLTGAFSAFASRRRSGGSSRSRVGSSPSSSPTGSGVGSGRSYTGLVVFKSQAARRKRHAKFLSEFRREERMAAGAAAAAAAAVRLREDPQEGMAVRSLNSLRSKARQTLERNAYEMEEKNPAGAERLREDARCIENWGREAEEGAKREAAGRAVRLNQDLAQKEAEQATARKKATAEARKAKKEAAEALVREEEMAAARARAEEEAKLAASAAEAAAAAAEAAAAAANVVQDRPDLSPEQVIQVQEAWSSPVGGADDDEVVVRAFNDMVSKGSLRTLRSGEWLGDEVINLYMKIIQARNNEAVANGEKVPKCGIMSSFFYTQLSDNGRGYRYQGVKRFLKKAKLDLFDLDKLIFPVNVNENHWTLAVINFRLRRLEYYDSLGSAFGDAGFQYMARFVDDESKAKRGGQPMDISDWPRFNYADVPRQRNGIDCGVFASMFADRLSKGRPLSFSQGDIGHCRKVMTLAILRGERPPTESEAFLEDGGQIPASAPSWWDPPPQAREEDEGAESYSERQEGEEDIGEGKKLGDGEAGGHGAGTFDLMSDAAEEEGDGEWDGASNGLDYKSDGGEMYEGEIYEETANEVDLTSEGDRIAEEDAGEGDDQEAFNLASGRVEECEEGIDLAWNRSRDEDEGGCVLMPLELGSKYADKEHVVTYGVEDGEDGEEQGEKEEANGETEDEGDKGHGEVMMEEEEQDVEKDDAGVKEKAAEMEAGEQEEAMEMKLEQGEHEESRGVFNGVIGVIGVNGVNGVVGQRKQNDVSTATAKQNDVSTATAEPSSNGCGGTAWPTALGLAPQQRHQQGQHEHAKKHHVKKQFLNRDRSL